MYISNIIRPWYLLILLVVLLLPGIDANAQYTPPGSYKDTCRIIQVIGGQLIAQCEKKDGTWQTSTLTIQNCEGPVSNDNGNLRCKEKPHNQKKPPSGSYRNSCKNERIDGKKLRAKCRTENGNWKSTGIKYKKCNHDIWNDDGNLSCAKKPSRVPKGSYKNSCKNIGTQGNILNADCKNRNGKWHSTSINYKNCSEDIWNDGGNLRCGSKRSTKLPKGSYKNSCKNIYIEDNILEAECEKDNGKWRHTSIIYKNCKQGLWNDNGSIRCNK